MCSLVVCIALSTERERFFMRSQYVVYNGTKRFFIGCRFFVMIYFYFFTKRLAYDYLLYNCLPFGLLQLYFRAIKGFIFLFNSGIPMVFYCRFVYQAQKFPHLLPYYKFLAFVGCMTILLVLMTIFFVPCVDERLFDINFPRKLILAEYFWLA